MWKSLVIPGVVADEAGECGLVVSLEEAMNDAVAV